MEATECADELPAEHLQAVKASALLATEVEVEGVPVRVRVAGIMAEDVEMGFPFVAAVPGANGVGQRPVESVALRDAEQRARGVVDQVRQLLHLIVEQPVPGMKLKLALYLGNAGKVAEDDSGHAP